jgi:hypothetical protein
MTDINETDNYTFEPNPALAGHATLEVDKNKLVAWVEACLAANMGYSLGAKAASLACQPMAGHCIDCSGFSRWALYHATYFKTLMPDGSQNQLQWCADQDFKVSDFASTENVDNILRIAFHKCDQAERIGHVWFVLNGKTIESCGGEGPCRRDWNTPVLERLCNAVFCVC